jgi:hypothetical protein
MTKFADQLLDDLMREHGPALAPARAPAPRKRRITARRALLAAGGLALAAAAAIAGTVVAGSETPAYAITNNPNGTITLAVYQRSGIAGANARLRQLGDQQVVVVPIEPGCPTHLPAPAVSVLGHVMSMGGGVSRNGTVTVFAHGIPRGDIVVVGVKTTAHGFLFEGFLTSPPAPGCIGLLPPFGRGGSGS